MPVIRIQEGASLRIDDIYRYTRNRWGDVQAEQYITGLFAAFDKIATHGVASKPVPAIWEDHLVVQAVEGRLRRIKTQKIAFGILESAWLLWRASDAAGCAGLSGRGQFHAGGR